MLHFERGVGFRCLATVAADPIQVPGVVIVRSDSAAGEGGLLPPGAAAWYEAHDGPDARR